MKIRNAITSVVAVAAIGGLVPAFAQAPEAIIVAPAPPVPGEVIIVPAVRPSGAIHGGFVTLEDERLLSDAVAAFYADNQTSGATVTMVANKGELVLNGSAKDVAQASRMERLAKQVAGGRAIAWFDSMGG